MSTREEPCWSELKTCDGMGVIYLSETGGRGSQVVRHGSAKAAFVGSIPTLASPETRF